MKKAFTLIELLIVVAIIAILAAIAVPNFLEAQVRSKISRVRSELRTLSIALETYMVDYNAIPLGRTDLSVSEGGLTSPIAYLSSVDFTDPFQPIAKMQSGSSNGNTKKSYLYFNFGSGPDANHKTWADRAGLTAQDKLKNCFLIYSNGPDRMQGAMEWNMVPRSRSDKAAMDDIYDPTNGTASLGDIGRVGGASGGPRAAMINTR